MLEPLMLAIDGEWIWDFWFADDGDLFHVFYLHAPRSLGDERRRHRAARIGHATSTDLQDWTVLGDVFDVGGPGEFDATATWTGSVVQGDDGLWRMFYTGARFHAPEPDVHNTETVGQAVSTDLHHWQKMPGPIASADPRWYETFGTSGWPEEAWRDPWVYRDAAGDGWHMLVTARAHHGPEDDRGVIGHAVSTDLVSWTVRPPATPPGLGFSHMEVPQLLTAPDGARSILFSCPRGSLADRLRDHHDPEIRGGVWALPVAAEVTAPLDWAPALVTDEQFYSARVVTDRRGDPQLIAVDNTRTGGDFAGRLTDPMPVAFGALGIPYLLRQPARAD